MQVNEITFEDARPIDGYGPGFFRVANEVIEGPIILTSTSLVSWQGYEDPSPLLNLAEKIDVILIGTGTEMRPIPSEMRSKLEAAGIGVEFMATPPACRTFNVLMAEGRRIAAALLPVQAAATN